MYAKNNVLKTKEEIIKEVKSHPKMMHSRSSNANVEKTVYNEIYSKSTDNAIKEYEKWRMMETAKLAEESYLDIDYISKPEGDQKTFTKVLEDGKPVSVTLKDEIDKDATNPIMTRGSNDYWKKNGARKFTYCYKPAALLKACVVQHYTISPTKGLVFRYFTTAGTSSTGSLQSIDYVKEIVNSRQTNKIGKSIGGSIIFKVSVPLGSNNTRMHSSVKLLVWRADQAKVRQSGWLN